MNIKDIAKAAGVAVSTVSRVINQHPDVNEDTRRKVLNVIDELNYIPNNSARNLKRSVSNSIGVFVKGIYNPFFARIIQEVGEEVNRRGYSMITHYNHDDSNDTSAAMELIKEKRLRGLICLGGEFEDLSEDQLREASVPIIFISSIVKSSLNKNLYSSFSIDNVEAAFEAVDYLCELGHRRIGIITSGTNENRIGGLRFKGYKKALEEKGIAYYSDYHEYGLYTFEDGYKAMGRLLDKNLNLTAIFVISDIMAIGAAKAILERGLSIPGDISVVGFDGIDYSAFFHPSITTVSQLENSIALRSVEALQELMLDKSEHRHLIMETNLIKRDSCKAVKKIKRTEDLLF